MIVRELFAIGRIPLRKVLVGVLVLWLVVFDVSYFFGGHPLMSTPAQASEVTITSSMNTTLGSQLQSGPRTVFVSDQVGYKFSRASNQCVYYKTTNGGDSWGSAVIVDGQTDCIKIAVHYDQWTPGDTGDYIHIVTMDTNPDDLYYNRLDTSSDTLLSGTSPANVTEPAGYPTVALNVNTNFLSITKSTEGHLFVSVDDDTASFVATCSTLCGTGSSWSEAGTTPLTAENNWSQLIPLLGGNVMLINRTLNTSVQQRTMQSRIWYHSSSSWSTSWDYIDTDANPNTGYDVAFSAVTSGDGDVYLAYIADANSLGSNDDVRTAYFNGTAWASTTDVVTDSSRGLTQVSLALDQNTDNVYVAYSGRTTPGTANTANVYWHRSVDGMSSWESEQGPVNASSGDFRGVDMNQISDERIYVSWYNSTAPQSINGDTVVDIVPGVEVSTLGTQVSEVRAGNSNIYSGGTFVFTETIEARNITSITLTEQGTIDAGNSLSNIKLFYETDSSNPYDCTAASYDGGDTQYGSTASNFSGQDGTASFVDTVSIAPDEILCFFVVYDVEKEAIDGETVSIVIADPSTQIGISGGSKIAPDTPVSVSGTTTVKDDDLTQNGYHWRLDNGSEITASSTTGGLENVALTDLPKSTPRRLRLGVANTGATTSPSISPQLEYATTSTVCSESTDWTLVSDTGAVWEMVNSPNITDGNQTTNIATTSGGVTDGALNFIGSNNGLKDTSASVSALSFGVNEFTEFEFSIQATGSALDGANYCFRITDNGTAFDFYTEYPSVSLAADTLVSTIGDQVATTSIPVNDAYLGGAFVIQESAGARNLTSITFTESGTIDAENDLSDIKLFYEFDTSLPYDCTGESYNTGEAQYGTTVSGGFSATSSVSFSDTVNVSTSSALCLYVVFDIDTTAQSGQSVAIEVADPQSDISLSGGGSIAPATPLTFSSDTLLEGAELELTGYHWRNDNGSESGATSATGQTENTPLLLVEKNDSIRLRTRIQNSSANPSPSLSYSLEYATKVVTCDVVSAWTPMDTSSGALVLFNSTNLTDGADTTDIATTSGGVSDGGGFSFVTNNNTILTTSTSTPAQVLSGNEYIEIEAAIIATDDAGFNTSYCIRVVSGNGSLYGYTTYPELTTAPNRDFKVQRSYVDITGTSTTLIADSDYDAPSSASAAFIRITNSHHTGAGRTTGSVNGNSDDVTAYIEDPENIVSSVTFARPGSSVADTRVYYEIVEYVGDEGADNEIVVRDAGTVTYGTSDLTISGPAVGGVEDDSDVVVFITGQYNPDISRADYESGQSTSNWNSVTNQPEFTRGHAGGDAGLVSYAVVEFVGLSWKIQRVEHTYTSVNSPEVEPIAPVGSLSRAFLHTQKNIDIGLQTVSNFGHNVWLSGLGQITFLLPSSATTPAGHESVAWVIENTQTTSGAMEVYQSDGTITGGTAPVTYSIEIGDTLDLVSEASIMVNTMVPGVTGTSFPRPIVGATIASSTHYELWRSNTTSVVNYRTEIIKWPTADTAVRQNFYRFYVDNGALLPTDPWPVGAIDLGENMSITGVDEPLASGEVVRLRMSLKVTNATLPESTRSYKLQYGLRDDISCEAIETWSDVGDAGSGEIWRGYDSGPLTGTTLSTDPPTGSDLVLSVSDRAGRYQYEGTSDPNPYSISPTEDVEYDWVLQHNGATQRSNYCFRMVNNDNSPLDGYLAYPTVRTVGYTPVVSDWRWYDDTNALTPVVPLASENTAPINIERGEDLTLRLVVAEIKNQSSSNVKFALQVSQSPTFADGGTIIVATTSCDGTEGWCYEEGLGVDNDLIEEAVISSADTCSGIVTDGCGTHNTIANSASTLTHPALSNLEFEFTLKNSYARTDGVFYFRPYDVVFGEPVVASSTYPSLVTESGTISLGIAGLPNATSTESITTNASTTPVSINFGDIPPDTTLYAAQRISISTNATEGYQVFLVADSQLENDYGTPIDPVTGTNNVPTGWSEGCLVTADGCFGYHSSDGVLFGGSSRFSPPDSYAALSTTPAEIIYNSMPNSGVYDIVYGIRVSSLQPAGDYSANISYIGVSSY